MEPMTDIAFDATQSIRDALPECNVAILREIGGGHSRARVFVVDISPVVSASPGQQTSVAPGQYILKIDAATAPFAEKPEADRHEEARNNDAPFAAAHIPALLRVKVVGAVCVMLYDIAGHSLSSFVVADAVDVGALRHYCGLLAQELLSAWNRHYLVNANTNADHTLGAWLGYRLDPTAAPALHDFVTRQTQGLSLFQLGGRALVDPLWLAVSGEARQPAATVALEGLIHGDLHAGNLLVDRTRQQSQYGAYWLIDFALSKRAPLGYDHAYLELALLIGHLQGAPPQRMLSLLEALDVEAETVAAASVTAADLGILACARALRDGVSAWQAASEPRRHDSFRAQQILAQVAAGLNWTNKPLDDTRRRLALAYSGHAATRYLHAFAPDVLERLRGQQPSAPAVEPVSPEWPDVWDQLGRFDDTRAKYVLVTGRLAATDEAKSLSLTPWSAILDFDPHSSDNGLHALLATTLSRVRSLNQYGRQPLDVDFDRGTAWLMVNGWPSRFEEPPVSFRQWRREYGDVIRSIGGKLRRAAAPLPIKVVVLATPDLSADYVKAVVAMLDEALEESSDISIFGSTGVADSAVKAYYPIAPTQFVSALHRVFGGVVQFDESTVPSADGRAVIPQDQLKNLEEDLAVLHSRILDDAGSAQDANSFWRGAPPSWHDLHANSDVPRSITSNLSERIRERLEERGNYTVELHHPPGAGGTTAALRCAWDLRRDYPVSVLHRYSSTSADRVDQLFRVSQKPVLLVAEGALLPAAQRDDLYREIAKRNARCVILYVVRRFGGDDASFLATRGSQNRFVLPDPLDDVESARFFEAFASRTSDPRRIRALKALTTSAALARYRNPFLYGLTTFEDDFESVDRYVTAHLEGIQGRVRSVLRYLAVVTRFTQTGISVGLLNRLLGLDAASDVDLVSAVGESIAHLMVQRATLVRLLHPVIATEVLRQTLGMTDEWQHGLRDVSVDLINGIMELLGPDASQARDLLTDLFIRRDFWTPGVRRRRNFSELIQAIPSSANQHQVLQTLAEKCPDEPHFWNHLGRHHIYEMKQDFAAAETYLKKAIELDPREQVHHHSLGMVRRFWIRSLLADELRSDTLPSPEQMFAKVELLMLGAAQEFELSRQLSPEDDHGYITHIQLIVEVLESLMRAEPGKSIVALATRRDAVGAWVRRAQVEAESLLGQVQQMRQQRPPSKYELRCVTGLAQVYDNFDALVASLEQLASAVEDADVRRALATAYHSRSGRLWGRVPEHELRRTKDLMEDNLRSDPTHERDIRNWFQAARRLPDFSYIDAIGRLESWANASDAVDAHYYLYVLHFLRWRGGAERDETALQASLENCRRRASGRRGISYEWLSDEPDWCPLVHASELGEWADELNFFERPEPLARPHGIIASIKPQAGTIRLGTRTVAHFVPGTKFAESRHINASVNFFLGFSYEGLRAWSVDFAHAPLNPVAIVPAGAMSSAAVVETRSSSIRSVNEQAQAPVKMEVSLRARVEMSVRDQITAATNRGGRLEVSALVSALARKFGKPPVHERLGYDDLESLIVSMGGVGVVTDDNKVFVVSVLPDLPKPSLAAVEAVVLGWIDQAPGRRMWLAELGGKLQPFRDKPVYKALGFKTLRAMLAHIGAVSVDATGQWVVRREKSRTGA
jgi:hypothetical protein